MRIGRGIVQRSCRETSTFLLKIRDVWPPVCKGGVGRTGHQAFITGAALAPLLQGLDQDAALV